MADAKKEKEMQEKFIIYQLMQKQLESFRGQAAELEKGFFETETTRQAIEDLKKINAENEIMIPLGSGFFVQGKITNRKGVLMSPGSSIMLEKDIKGGLEAVEKRKADIENASRDLQKQINEVVQKINELGPELEQMVAETRKKS